MTIKHLGYAGLLSVLVMFPGVHAAEIIVNGATVVIEGTNAISIANIDIDGTLYDVSFERDTYGNLNDGNSFPFVGDVFGTGDETGAIFAAKRIVDTLEQTPATTAGPSNAGGFYIPWRIFDTVSPQYLNAIAVGKSGSRWSVNGQGGGSVEGSWLFATVSKVRKIVEVDVDPWSSANEVNPNSSAKIVVAVMGSSTANGDPADFDVQQINPDSLKLGTGETPNFAASPLLGDYDNDSNMDAAFAFETQATGILCNDPSVKLTGATFGGDRFEGTATIVTTDCSTPIIGGTLTVVGDTTVIESAGYGEVPGNQQFALNLVGGGTNVIIHTPYIGTLKYSEPYAVHEGITSAHWGGSITSQLLVGVDLLLIYWGLPEPSPYTAAEETVIRNFLLAGGNVAFVAENNDSTFNIGGWNSFLEALGSSIRYSYADRCCAGSHYADTVLTTPLSAGIYRLKVATINDLNGGTPVIQDQGFTAVAYETISLPYPAVEIDVDPWNDANIVRPDSNDTIAVAIMGSSTANGDATNFDVYQVDPASLKFGAGAALNTAANALYGDYDGDTNTDAAFAFRTQNAGILCDDTDVTLQGKTFGGTPFESIGTITTTDCVDEGCHP